MKSDNVAIILQKPLQEAFDTECRCYGIYLKAYESMLEKWKNLKMQLDELKEKQELDEKISSYRQAFKKRLNGIPISVSNILDDASKENVKLEFREKILLQKDF